MTEDTMAEKVNSVIDLAFHTDGGSSEAAHTVCIRAGDAIIQCINSVAHVTKGANIWVSIALEAQRISALAAQPVDHSVLGLAVPAGGGTLAGQTTGATTLTGVGDQVQVSADAAGSAYDTGGVMALGAVRKAFGAAVVGQLQVEPPFAGSAAVGQAGRDHEASPAVLVVTDAAGLAHRID